VRGDMMRFEIDPHRKFTLITADGTYEADSLMKLVVVYAAHKLLSFVVRGRGGLQG
jgi:hypothetical protein